LAQNPLFIDCKQVLSPSRPFPVVFLIQNFFGFFGFSDQISDFQWIFGSKSTFCRF